MNVAEETKYILNKYKVQANKSLGQNFLINENVVDSIIEASELNDEDLVIEIGPGLGVLTNRIIKNVYKLIAVELDKNMINILSNRFKDYKNIKLINEDILKIDLNKLINQEKELAIKNGKAIKKVKVIANLPYYISTPIIMKLLEERYDINNIIVMVQKEVADRLIAIPGTKSSGAITYAIDYYAIPYKVIDVEKDSFIPQPKVESEVIKLCVRDTPKFVIDDEKTLFNIIKKSFSQRRKTLINVLLNYGLVSNKNDAMNILNKLELDINVRGETLSLEQFVKLYNSL